MNEVWIPASQLLVVLVLAGAVLIYRKRMGALWIFLIIEIFLMTTTARIIDEIGVLYGIDPIPPHLSYLLRWLFIAAVGLAILRFVRLGSVIRDREERIRRLEELRARDERGMSWDHIPKYPNVWGRTRGKT